MRATHAREEGAMHTHHIHMYVLFSCWKIVVDPAFRIDFPGLFFILARGYELSESERTMHRFE